MSPFDAAGRAREIVAQGLAEVMGVQSVNWASADGPGVVNFVHRVLQFAHDAQVAERERAAKVADNKTGSAAREIAAAIRVGEEGT